MSSTIKNQETFYSGGTKIKTLLGACLMIGSFALFSIVLFVAGPQLGISIDTFGAFTEYNSKLAANLGVSGGAAAAIWDAANSWWAAALSILLVPMGFGAWAVTLRLTAQMLIRQLGARRPGERF